MSNESSKKLIQLEYIIFPVFLCLLVAVGIIFRKEISLLLSDSEVVREWLLERRGWSVLLFISLQILQVVIFLLPGEFIQIAGGYVFDPFSASLYSLTGITLGSLICFSVSRYSGVAVVRRIVGEKNYRRFEHSISSKGALGVFFLIFLIPGFPKDVLYYLGGLSRIPFLLFIASSMVARLPGIVGSSVIGLLLLRKNWNMLILLALLTICACILLAVFNRQLSAWLDRMLKNRSTE